MHLKTVFGFVGLLSPALAQNVVPGAYIAEIKGTTANGFLNKARVSGIKVSHRMTLDQDTSIFNGVSFKLEEDTPENRAKISSWREVVKLFPIQIYNSAAPMTEQVVEDVGKIIKRSNWPVDSYPPHVQGGVDKVRAEGLDGQGIKVAIVDTGIDYTHPSLGGGFGPGFKVAVGYDFVGDSYNGQNTPVPDNDPMDCGGHGTHVAGIVAAIDTRFDFTGVAPNVTLGAYKVFGCPSIGTTDDVLISAFTRAVADGADVISASVSSSGGWGEYAWPQAVTRIVEDHSIPCVIAGGNSGGQGLFYASSAADAVGAIGVGHVDSLIVPRVYQTATIFSSSGQNALISYFTATLRFPVGQLFELYVPTVDGQISDGCVGLPADSGDISQKIVVMRAGNCPFQDKIDAATEKGALKILLIEDPSNTFSMAIDGFVYVSRAASETNAALLALLSSGGTLSVTFQANPDVALKTSNNLATGGSISTGSSWGPTNRLYQRPHVCAPGAFILSTTRSTLNQGYSVLSGSSMAAPYISGVVALYLQKARAQNRIVTPAEIRIGLTTTAQPLVFNDGTKNFTFLAPIAQQGGGMIDAYKFIRSNTVVDTDFLEFNDTQNFHASISFKITNKGAATANYQLTSIAGATAYTTMENSTLPQTFPPTMVQSYASVSIDPSNLTINPGQSKRVVVRVVPPIGLDASRIPVYGGWIKIARDADQDNLKIPYMGIATKIKDATVTNFEQGYPKLTSSLVNNPTNPPVLAWGLVLASGTVRIDVVSVSDPAANDVRIFNADNIIGSVPGYPSYWNPRSPQDQDTQVSWDGTVVKYEGLSPIAVPAGTYKFIYRALKMSGRNETGRDYERWVSPNFVWSLS
ncbi:hypothetical protein TWF481_010359 [Arthrobotrys musiformis]|uniref:Uncharacterized protein n=1 Tax=Arthrobotrys musiformis TaxID=47236 RepID=A0AAV9W0N5_9PEZI